ncbi:L-fucose:H+ symporter permease [Auraticoccus monumenti]|uniref:MFS transporter, FHS family, L-fucose permease n=1 Tax=Auraticoccus monumenti TaxID=675864 RepID=A0A1G7DF08_9ACTN|nr:L-fucose:H+ symporter permease [Auraticoccus monumenti]SDE50103.1 MFS transporter, FHS family, L-fucose permease [Auraticoccus monumenti]
MSSTSEAAEVHEPLARPRLVERHLLVPFILLVCCFAAWGAAANLTDILVGVFRSIFDMSNFQSSLVQFAYYGAYFLLAIPAAFINRRYGYKAGVLVGLGLAAVGGLLFIPASQFLQYGFFLLALFVLAAGLSILETSANPFVLAMGSEESSTRRLNLAQAFNPVGANVGVLLGAVLILPQLTSEAAKTIMTPEQLVQSQEADLGLVLRPYLGIAAVLVLIWLLIAFRKMSVPAEQGDVPVVSGNALGRLWANRHYRYGVAAQFFNVAAQTCIWTFTILYAQDVVGVSAESSGWFLQASLIIFLLARFAMVYLLGIVQPARLLLIMAVVGVVLCLVAMFSLNMVGLLAVVGLSASLSLMFPTIYGVALQGLGADAKFGAAGLVMAILGGALAPMVHGAVMDQAGAAKGYVVPAVCLALVAAYALFDLRSHRPGVGEPDRETVR